MLLKILNLQGGNEDGFKQGVRYTELEKLKAEMLDYLEQGNTEKCWVIQKDNNIKTTVLYFDIDHIDYPFSSAYSFIHKYLSRFYDNDMLDTLKFKNKSEENYHIYFVNIFVDKQSLKTLVKNINNEYHNEYRKKIVDEACIHNFIKFEGFKKYKNGQFVDNSEYEMIIDDNTHGLSITDCYEAIYDFNKPVTPTKVALPAVPNSYNQDEQKSNDHNDHNEHNEQKKYDKNKRDDTVSQLCNDLFNTDYQWSVEPRDNANSVLLHHNSLTCVVDPNHSHSQKNHSCAFINKFGKSVIKCHSHGKKNVPKGATLKRLKQHLGLCKSDNDKTDLQVLIQHIKNVAQQHKYKKTNSEYIVKPNPDIPVLYETLYTFDEFINQVFNNNQYLLDLYEKHPTNHDNLIKYLKKYNPVELPFIQYNRHIYAFNNGFLDISNLYSIKFYDYSCTTNQATSIYYPLDFDTDLLKKHYRDISTPIFDKICMNHFERTAEKEDIYNCFLGMIGRLHYPTHTYDKFNCSMFIKGGSNTGKSTVGGIIMHNHQNIGTVGSKLEDTFGLESYLDNDIIYCPDLPKNFAKRLDKSDLQRMIEGEGISVARKNKTAINNYIWKKQMLWLGNYFFGYQDSSGAIPRRMCIFFMDRYIPHRDTTLQDRCKETEGHLLLIKTLKAYCSLIERFKNQTYEDWDIKYFQEGRNELTTKVNNLYNFLTLAPKEFDYWCVHEQGYVTVLKGRNNFQDVFEYYLKRSKTDQKRWIKDTTTLEKLGFEYKEKKVCGVCNRKANKKDCICVGGYNEMNKKKKACLINLRIISLENYCDKCGSDPCRCKCEIQVDSE